MAKASEPGAIAIVLGDQLDFDSPALRGCRHVVMVEAAEESLRIHSHRARTALFFSAMRHFAQSLTEIGMRVHYRRLEDAHEGSLVDQLFAVIKTLPPAAIQVLEPGDWRIEQALIEASRVAERDLQVLEDPQALCSRKEFGRYASKRSSLRMEFFYRDMRKRHRILIQADGEPEGGQWNFDVENRKAFGARGPSNKPAPIRFPPDETTKIVIDAIEKHVACLPGSCDSFAWPVNRDQALKALEHFIANVLPQFGPFQDAMWSGEPFLWHSLLGSSLNLRLLRPLEVIQAACSAYQNDPARYPLATVEGFVRQILGWREFMRGLYWLRMPEMAEANFFEHQAPLPAWFWTGDCGMNCLRETVKQTLDHAYAHHIQRLMVIGNFSLLAGLEPRHVANWFHAVYVDAIDWVHLPNVIVMALHAMGPSLSSKPYIASGQYIARMSNYCKRCDYRPALRDGPGACPFTVFYWDFLQRHRESMEKNPRMFHAMRQLKAMDPEKIERNAKQAELYRQSIETI